MAKDVAYLIDRTRIISDIGNNKPDSEVLKYINIAYQDFIDYIKANDKGVYFSLPLTTTLIAGEYRYKMEPPADSPIGMDGVKQVEVLWSTDDEHYSYVEKDSLTSYRKSEDYLLNELSTDEAFWDLRLAAIHLYPMPKNTVVNGIRVWSGVIYPDLQEGGSEDTIFTYHKELLNHLDAVIHGASYYSKLARGMTGEAERMLNLYNIKRKEALKTMKSSGPATRKLKPTDYSLYH